MRHRPHATDRRQPSLEVVWSAGRGRGTMAAMTWIVLAIAALWLAMAAIELRGVRSLQRLPRRRDNAPRTAVTVVVPVRDGVDHVEDTVRRLLAQQDTDLRLVVVDDRSSDGTGDVLRTLAAADARLTVRTVRELPRGWLGKSHALHEGTRDVATPWLLFVDADSRLAPDLVARAIDAAIANGADHVALLPDIVPTSTAGRACVLAFQSVVADRLRRVNAPRQRDFVGTGAFNLVRTEAYRAIGGHERLRLEVVDDVWLGGLLFRRGFRSRLWIATPEISVDWGGTPRQLLRDVEKNMFAVLRYRTWVALPLGLAGLLLVATTWSAPWWAGRVGFAALGAFAATAVPTTELARRNGWPLLPGLLAPFGRALLPLALLRSLLRTLWHRGVSWRGTFYSLAELRRGQV